VVASDWGPLAGPPAGVWAVENRLQSLRSVVEAGQVGATLRGTPDGSRRGVAQHRQHHKPRPSARRGRKRGAKLHAIGRSRGGLSTKVHLIVDALGLPAAFEITEGQRHDNQRARALIARTGPRCLLADKAYDSNAIRSQLAGIGCAAVIPSTTIRAIAPPYDKELYKARSAIECTFNLLKQARRFATRYEKTLRNYAAVVAIGCALLWLRL